MSELRFRTSSIGTQYTLAYNQSCMKYKRDSNELKNVLHNLPELFHDRGPYHIETSRLICTANRLTGFYMIVTSVMKELSLLIFMRTIIFTSFIVFFSQFTKTDTSKIRENHRFEKINTLAKRLNYPFP